MCGWKNDKHKICRRCKMLELTCLVLSNWIEMDTENTKKVNLKYTQHYSKAKDGISLGISGVISNI